MGIPLTLWSLTAAMRLGPAGPPRRLAMGAIYVSWCISGVVLLGLAVVVGRAATARIDGILIDERRRYRLSHLQLCLWSITILSLLSGVFFGRLIHGVADPLGI